MTEELESIFWAWTMKYLKGEANGEGGGGGDAQATRLVKVVFWFGHYKLLIVVKNFSTICSRIFNYAISHWMFFCCLARLTGN